jgi:hypothetical protein
MILKLNWKELMKITMMIKADVKENQKKIALRRIKERKFNQWENLLNQRILF